MARWTQGTRTSSPHLSSSNLGENKKVWVPQSISFAGAFSWPRPEEVRAMPSWRSRRGPWRLGSRGRRRGTCSRRVPLNRNARPVVLSGRAQHLEIRCSSSSTGSPEPRGGRCHLVEMQPTPTYQWGGVPGWSPATRPCGRWYQVGSPPRCCTSSSARSWLSQGQSLQALVLSSLLSLMRRFCD